MAADIATSAVVYPNVVIGEGTQISAFAILGQPPRGHAAGEVPLTIGSASLIRSHSVVYAGSMIGQRFQLGHQAMVRENCRIGDSCSIGTGSVLEFNVELGDHVRLHSRVFVPEFTIIETGAWIGPNVVVTNARYPSSTRAKELLQGVIVRSGAKIGANATLLPGIEIGQGSLVGAGSVVTRDVPAWSVVYGCPARIAGDVRELRYPDTGELIYPESGS